MNPSITSLADQLERQAYAVVDDFLPTQVLSDLAVEVEKSLENFRQAHIGRGMTEQRMSEVRGDRILWLDQETLTPAQHFYFREIDLVRTHLSVHFRIALNWFECHLAAYPVGSHYARHLDQFRETNNRIFSVILYLNENWTDEDGGQLRIYRGDDFEDIRPKMGRLVCFRSDLIEHEVLPTNRTRFSITGWIRRDVPTPVFL